jgi:hypothetical protein
MLQSLAPMLSEFLRQHTGGYGFTFGSDMNVANAQLAREFMAQVNNARTAGARADQGQVTDVLRGMARVSELKPGQAVKVKHEPSVKRPGSLQATVISA